MSDAVGSLPTAEELPSRPTSNVKIEQVLDKLRTRRAGHLADAIELIEAMRQERDRRQTAMNVLGVIVSLLLDIDQAAPPTRTMNPMRRALLENALERAVLALYPESIAEAIHAGDPRPVPSGSSPAGAPDGTEEAGAAARPDGRGTAGSPQDLGECLPGGTITADQPGDQHAGQPVAGDDEHDPGDPAYPDRS